MGVRINIVTINEISYRLLLAAYKVFLEYNENEPFPTEASVKCDMGDEKLVSLKVDEIAEEGDVTNLLRYKIVHEYTLNGEYNISCK